MNIIGRQNIVELTRASGVFSLDDIVYYKSFGYKWPTDEVVRANLLLHLDAINYSGSGSVFPDASTSGTNATIVGSPTFNAEGFFTNFSDANYITVPNTNFKSIGTANFTFSTWVRCTTNTTSDTIFENGSWTDAVLLRYDNATTLGIYTENNSQSFTHSRANNVWYNIVIIRYNERLYLFINNVQIGSIAYAHNISIANNNCFIGRSQYATAQFFNGDIAVLMYYNRALSTYEVARNFHAQKRRFGLS